MTEAEKEGLTRYYEQLLTFGYAEFCPAVKSLVFWVDRIAVTVLDGTSWELTPRRVYIPTYQDVGEMANPQWKLSVILAMMSCSGHVEDTRLMKLVEDRLTALLTGLYSVVTAPLATRENGQAIGRIAWSLVNGLAADINGAWYRPITGEPVTVDESWVILELVKASPKLTDTAEAEAL